MNRKHSILSLVLVLVMLLSITSAATAASLTDVVEVDPCLVGSWTCYATSYVNDYRNSLFDFFEDLEIILPTGVFTDTYDCRILDVLGVSPLVASTADGETDLGEAFVGYLNEYIEISGDESLAEVLSTISDIEVSYEFYDISPEEIGEDGSIPYSLDSEKPFYDLYSDDGLHLHVKATLKPSPLTTKIFEAVYSFRRVPVDSNFMRSMLCGDWTDTDGNFWSFGFEADENGYPEFAYTLTLADGTVYTGESVYMTQDRETAAIEAEFWFEEFYSPEYQFTALDAETAVFESPDGDLILTRS